MIENQLLFININLLYKYKIAILMRLCAIGKCNYKDRLTFVDFLSWKLKITFFVIFEMIVSNLIVLLNFGKVLTLRILV